jgi:hypothetical protein
MSLDPKSKYYDAGGIEVMDVIRAKLTPEQFEGYLLGNVIKYSLRANHKGQKLRDIEKIENYAKELHDVAAPKQQPECSSISLGAHAAQPVLTIPPLEEWQWKGKDSLCPKCGLLLWSGHRCAAILEGEEHMSALSEPTRTSIATRESTYEDEHRKKLQAAGFHPDYVKYGGL